MVWSWCRKSLLARLALAECWLLFNFMVIKFYLTQQVSILSELTTLDRLFKAVIDNSVHFSIACTSWFIGTYTYTSRLQVLFCAFLASSIDVDHFLQARSLSLTGAISLKHRPFLHNSANLLALNLALLILMVFGHQTRLVKFF